MSNSLVVFFSTLSFAFFEPFFIGYLISIAVRFVPGDLYGERGRRLG
jgi:hypothetical protein